MKLAILTHPGEGWQAGIVTLTGLMHCLRALAGEAPELALAVWAGTPDDEYRLLLPHADSKIVVPQARPAASQAAPPNSLRAFLRWWLSRQLGRRQVEPPGRFRSDALQQRQIDCALSLPLEYRPDFGLPLVFWLPDLQHWRLPEMFPAHERARRDRLYRRELAAATLVWVKSQAVRQDIETFAPDQAAKARVLPFVPSISPAVYDEDPGVLLAAYHLPERFLLLPNQFWMHKNHLAVLEALRLLRQRSIRPTVVCTGYTVDHRNPEHFSTLLNKQSLWDLRDQFIILGVAPHAHVLGLMRQAVCLINPALFEGFGLSLAESISLGKRALVSDLPAHREQAAPGVLYFDPRDARDLADKIEFVWQTAQPGPDIEMEAAARAALPGRQREFGRGFLALANEAITLWQAGPQPAARQP